MIGVYFDATMHTGRNIQFLELPETLWYGTLIAVGYFDVAFQAEGWACALETMMHQLANYEPARPTSHRATLRRDSSSLVVLRFIEFGTLDTYQVAMETLLRGPIAMHHNHLVKVPNLLVQFIDSSYQPRYFPVTVVNCVLTWVPIHHWPVVYIMLGPTKCPYLMITSGNVRTVHMRVALFELKTLNMDA